MQKLEGVVMELLDSAYPLVKSRKKRFRFITRHYQER